MTTTTPDLAPLARRLRVSVDDLRAAREMSLGLDLWSAGATRALDAACLATGGDAGCDDWDLWPWCLEALEVEAEIRAYLAPERP